MAQSTLLTAAIAYVSRLGWAVFPCRGKVPAIRGGRGCLDATRDVKAIQRWWDEVPDANVGIACGEPSGVWVLDIDGEEGEEALSELESEHGPLPPTIEQLTGGGGRHLLFRFGGEKIRNAVRFAPGLDVRATGGYIVVAPSIHPNTKRAYAWSVDAHPLDTRPAAAPTWLVAKVTASDAKEPAKVAAPCWQEVAGEVIAEGRRNATLAKIAGHLLRAGVEPFLARDLAFCWNAHRCRPPLPEVEVFRTVDSIAGRELKRRYGDA